MSLSRRASRHGALAEAGWRKHQHQRTRGVFVQPFEKALTPQLVARGSGDPRGGSLEDHAADYARMRPGVLIATVTAATLGRKV